MSTRQGKVKFVAYILIGLVFAVIIVGMAVDIYRISIAVFLKFGENLCDGPLDLVEERISPNGKVKAIAYLTDCGATTAYTPNVSVIWANDTILDEKGNVDRETMKGLVFRGHYRATHVKLTWLSDAELEVEHSGDSETVMCKDSSDPWVKVKCRGAY